MKPAAERTKTRHVGVLATPATFQGELFASLVDRFGGEVRVHEHFGGRSRPVELRSEAVEVSLAAVAAVVRRRARELPYARVDLTSRDIFKSLGSKKSYSMA